MSAGVDGFLRFGPAIVLAITVARLSLATRRTSREIGGHAFGFGGSLRQRLAHVLFTASIAGAAVALTLHALENASTLFLPLFGEMSAVRLAGLGLAIAGQVLAVMARNVMGRRWRVGIPATAPDALVTTGIFGLSRNPVFLGMLAMAAGLGVAVPSPAVIACALLFWVACEIQVRDEERFLKRSSSLPTPPTEAPFGAGSDPVGKYDPMRRPWAAPLAATTLLLALAGSVAAEQLQAGSLTIDDPTSRPTPPGAKVGVGYVSVRNDGTEADRLIGGSASVAGRVEIHASTVEDGVARMRRVEDGIVLEPGATVTLAARGPHLMLLDLKAPIAADQTFDGTLVFERAGIVPVRFTVHGFGGAAATHSHLGHRP